MITELAKQLRQADKDNTDRMGDYFIAINKRMESGICVHCGKGKVPTDEERTKPLTRTTPNPFIAFMCESCFLEWDEENKGGVVKSEPEKKSAAKNRSWPNPSDHFRNKTEQPHMSVGDLIKLLSHYPEGTLVVTAARRPNRLDTPFVKPAFIGKNPDRDDADLGEWCGEFVSAHPLAIAPKVDDPFGAVVIEPFEVEE